MTMSKLKTRECELLSFRKEGNRATVATNGEIFVVQTPEEVRDFLTLWKSIAYLEARGWTIDTDGCKGF